MIKNVEPLLKECEETLKELKRMGNMEVACYVQGFINSINKLPDADQRPHGEWIDRSDGGRIRYPFWERYECSKCGAKSEDTNFCPNCGADMRKEGDTSEVD